MEGSETVPKGQEGEELNVALDQQFEDDPSEGVGSQQTADFIAKEAAEEPIEEEDQQQHNRHMEGEEIHGASHEQVVFPFLLHVPSVRLRVVEADVLDARLHSLLGPIQPGDFPLLLLDKLDCLKNSQGRPIILLAVIVVQPQIVQCQEHRLKPSPLDEVQDGPEFGCPR